MLAADRKRLRFMIEHCRPPAEPAVIEVGCGTGRLLRELTRMLACSRALGVDVEPAMLQQAGGIETRVGDAQALPVDDAEFDLAYMSLVFHLLDDRPAAAHELWRILKPGGAVAIWTLTPEHVRNFHLNRYFPSLAETDLARFEEPETWARHLAEAGFDEVTLAEMTTVRRTTAGRLARAVNRRYISTLGLLPEHEFADGARALSERAAEAPHRSVSYRQHWCLIWGRK